MTGWPGPPPAPPVPQRFTCRIEAFSAADGASLTGADILVLDLPGLDPSPILSRLARRYR